MQYMVAAVPLIRAKEVRDDGSIIEIVVWELLEPLPPSTHRYKYRLYYSFGGTVECATTTNVAKATIDTLGSWRNTTHSPRLNSYLKILVATWRTGARQ
jgi:hypothetical protein